MRHLDERRKVLLHAFASVLLLAAPVLAGCLGQAPEPSGPEGQLALDVTSPDAPANGTGGLPNVTLAPIEIQFEATLDNATNGTVDGDRIRWRIADVAGNGSVLVETEGRTVTHTFERQGVFVAEATRLDASGQPVQNVTETVRIGSLNETSVDCDVVTVQPVQGSCPAMSSPVHQPTEDLVLTALAAPSGQGQGTLTVTDPEGKSVSSTNTANGVYFVILDDLSDWTVDGRDWTIDYQEEAAVQQSVDYTLSLRYHDA